MRIISKHRTILILISVFSFTNCHRPASKSDQSKQEPYSWEELVLGGDLSYINQIEDHGGVYKDNGINKDPFKIFREHGANTVRVRLWNDPDWQAALNNGRLYNDLRDVSKTIRRSKENGMAVCLNLHYSDTWADPDHQEKPKAWNKSTVSQLADSVYAYTKRVLEYFASQGMVPEMIQVGNENNNGMLWPEGKVIDNDWKSFALFLQSGIRAVRDFSLQSKIKPRIILHVAQLQHALPWLEGITKAGVIDYDIIGLSHYSKWTTINDMGQVAPIIKSIKDKYGKRVMLVETAYPWTGSSADNYGNIISGTEEYSGYKVSKEEQFRFLRDLTQQVINGGGSGIIYWEPAWISSSLRDRWGQGSAWENCALFDFEGNVLPGMDFMRYRYD